MYLSQLIPNLESRGVLNDLANPYQLHRTLLSAFPDKMPTSERVLFRLEQQRTGPTLSILVQSRTMPDWHGLYERGYLLSPGAIKTFDLQLTAEQIYRFRLLANPTKRLKGDGKEDGKRVGLLREEDQLAWLIRKAGLNGFEVLDVLITKTQQPDAEKIVQGHKHHIHYTAVRFDGLLKVAEPESFRLGWLNGIGSGKGLGFGLLSLSPVG